MPTAWAAPSNEDTEEIEHLISYLALSDCTFYRNGTWYSASRAAQHLRDKYDKLLEKELVTTAESFIERGASRSSVSGKPYLVRCGSAEPVEAEGWFRAELQRFRDSKRVATASIVISERNIAALSPKPSRQIIGGKI